MTSPETLELEAVDAALAGRYVAPEHAELAELALLLRDDRPEPAAAWTTHLDRRVEAGFPALPRRRFVWLRKAAPALAIAACLLPIVAGAALIDTAVQRLSRLGRVRGLSRSTVDITASVVSARERLTDARAERKALLTQLADADTVNETESIRERLEIVSREIASARAALRGRVPVFDELADDDLRRVAEVTVPRRFAAGEFVFREGDDSDTCYVVHSGHARAIREHPDGRQITLATFGPGDIFGELAMFDSERRSATVEATDELEVLGILGGDMRRLLSRHPDMAVKLVISLGPRPRAANERVPPPT